MFCTICGKKNKEGLEFCNRCSALLYQSPELPQQLQQPQTQSYIPLQVKKPQQNNSQKQIKIKLPTAKNSRNKTAGIFAIFFGGFAVIAFGILILTGVLFNGDQSNSTNSEHRPDGTYTGRIDGQEVSYTFSGNNFKATLYFAGQDITLEGAFTVDDDMIHFDLDRDHLRDVMLDVWRTYGVTDEQLADLADEFEESIDEFMSEIAEIETRWFYEEGNTHIETDGVRLSRR